MAETDINYEYFGIVWVSLLYIKKKKKRPEKQQQHISIWWQVYSFATYIKMTEVRYILCVCVLRKCNIVYCMLVCVFLCKIISRSCGSVSLATSLGQSWCSSTFSCTVDVFLIAFYLDYNKTWWVLLDLLCSFLNLFFCSSPLREGQKVWEYHRIPYSCVGK